MGDVLRNSSRILGEMMLLGVMGYPSLAAGTAGDRRIPPTASNGAACDISRRRRTATRILSREDRHGAPLSRVGVVDTPCFPWHSRWRGCRALWARAGPRG